MDYKSLVVNYKYSGRGNQLILKNHILGNADHKKYNICSTSTLQAWYINTISNCTKRYHMYINLSQDNEIELIWFSLCIYGYIGNFC